MSTTLYPRLAVTAAGFIAYAPAAGVIWGAGATEAAARADAARMLDVDSPAMEPEGDDPLRVLPATADLLREVEGGEVGRWSVAKDAKGALIACSRDEHSEAVEVASEQGDGENRGEAEKRERRFALSSAGEALFGPEWVSPTARALGVAVRTAQRWMVQGGDVPDWALKALPGLAAAALKEGRVAELERRAAEIRRLAAEVKPLFPAA